MDGSLIKTERLELRPLTRAALGVLHGHWSLPEVGRWLFDEQIPSRQDVRAELAKSTETFATLGVGIWGVYKRGAGAFIGTCGLLPVPEDTGDLEIIFSLQPTEWGRGYATEASLAVLKAGFEQLDLDEIVGRCDVPNEPSRRLLEKLGMEFVKQEPIKGVDCLHYRLERAVFQARGLGASGSRPEEPRLPRHGKMSTLSFD